MYSSSFAARSAANVKNQKKLDLKRLWFYEERSIIFKCKCKLTKKNNFYKNRSFYCEVNVLKKLW